MARLSEGELREIVTGDYEDGRSRAYYKCCLEEMARELLALRKVVEVAKSLNCTTDSFFNEDTVDVAGHSDLYAALAAWGAL